MVCSDLNQNGSDMKNSKQKMPGADANQAAELAKQLKPLGSSIARIAENLNPVSKMLEDSAAAKIGKSLAGFDFAGTKAIPGMMKPLDVHRKALERLEAVSPTGIKLPESASSAAAKIGKALASFDFAGTKALADIAKSTVEHRKALERLQTAFPAGMRLPESPAMPDPLSTAPGIHNFRLPPNPIHKTNRYLARLTEKIEALFDVQAEQAKLIDALLQAQIENAKGQDRMARKQYLVAVAGILIAVLAIFLSAAF